MIVKLKEVEITKELIRKWREWSEKGASFKNAKNKAKYVVFDWRGLETFDFSLLDENDFFDIELKEINNKKIALDFYKHKELENEEFLWSDLVDNNIISGELYIRNSYEENFNILVKMTDFYLPLK